MGIRYVLKQQQKKDGLWISDVQHANTFGDVQRAVRAGWLNGEPRWAETLEGKVLYKLDAQGIVVR